MTTLVWFLSAGAAVITLILCYQLLVAVSNLLHFPRLTHTDSGASDGPEQSLHESLESLAILIPARNEAGNISKAVKRILGQVTTLDFRLFVLDDQSEDGTAAAALSASEGDVRLTVLHGAPLPAGWTGKAWACHQLAQAAMADLFLFADADVDWEPGALETLLTWAKAAGNRSAGLYSIWPTQETQSWSERAVVPLMSYVLLANLPLVWVHHFPHRLAAAANGQCLLFRREAYEVCGGHERVRGSLVEDVALARNIKSSGYALRQADGGGLIRTRMYTDWPSVRDGYAKNILAGHGDSVIMLLLSTLFHVGAFVAPWFGLLVAPAQMRWLPIAMLALGAAVRLLTARVTRLPAREVLWTPVGVLLLTAVAFRALWWKRRYRGVRWKGRTVRSLGGVG